MIDGFFSANRYRNYPFQDGTTGVRPAGPLTLRNLSKNVIVDCGFIVGPASGFNAAYDTIYLAHIRRDGNLFFFDFESDCPGLHGYPLTFVRHAHDRDFLTEYVDSIGVSSIVESTASAGLSASLSTSMSQVDPFVSLGSDSLSGQLCDLPLWTGFMVSGVMSSLDLFLAANGTLTGHVPVEQALIQNMADSCVTSINLANDDRTRAESPTGCPVIVWPYTPGTVFVNSTCLLGAISLIPGYNSTIRQNAVPARITLSAAVGAGAGEPCAEIPLYPGEEPPVAGSLLSGSPQCNNVVRSINGQGGPAFTLTADSGAVLTINQVSHTLAVNVNMSGLTLCYDSVSSVSETL
jgi:hypothetical protein